LSWIVIGLDEFPTCVLGNVTVGVGVETDSCTVTDSFGID
jgi:hypothetical protein